MIHICTLCIWLTLYITCFWDSSTFLCFFPLLNHISSYKYTRIYLSILQKWTFRFPIFDYSWHLNTMGLNWATPLIHRLITINNVNVFSLPYDLHNNISLFSLLCCKNTYIIHITQKCVNQLFNLSVRLEVSSGLSIVKFWENQVIWGFLDFIEGLAPQNSRVSCIVKKAGMLLNKFFC